jgi:hypothetical protein
MSSNGKLDKEKLKKESPILYDILKKQFSYIGLNLDEIEPSDEYFTEYEWTRNAEQDFIEWLADAIYNSKEIRESFLGKGTSYNTKQRARDVANSWVWNYGFHIPDAFIAPSEPQHVDKMSHELTKNDLIVFPKKINRKASLGIGRILSLGNEQNLIILEVDTNKIYKNFKSYQVMLIRTMKEENLEIWKKIRKK